MSRNNIQCDSKFKKILWSLYGLLFFIIFIILLIPFLILFLPISAIVGLILTINGLCKGNTQDEWRDHDTRIFNSTNNSLLRFLLSTWTNSREPMPSGGEKGRWKEDPQFWRYIKWHIRNPFQDLLSLYFGFHEQRKNYTQLYIFQKGEYNGKFYLEYIIKKVPNHKLIFPYFKILYGEWTFAIGWKRRGIVGFELNSDRN